MTRSADLRYAGQAFELTLPVGPGPYDPADKAAIQEVFEALHQRSYGYRLPGIAVEVVTLRANGTLQETTLRATPRHVLPPATVPGLRRAWFGPELGAHDTPVIGRATLTASARPGPLIIEEYEGTTVVPPDCTASLDADMNIVIRVEPARPVHASTEELAHAGR